jgi:hypothetical protein
MTKICAKLVTKNLSDEQQYNRVLLSRELLDRVTNEPDFLRLNQKSGSETLQLLTRPYEDAIWSSA